MSVIPLLDRVLIQPKDEDTVKNGIIVSESEETVQSGLVIDPGVSRDLRQGDVVLFGKDTGDKVDVEGEIYLLVKAENIVARVK